MARSEVVPCLVVDSISKRYRGEPVVDELSFSVQPGRTYGLLGPNGSGKSTTLHILTGLLRPTAGSVRLHGVPITSKESRRYLGFAPDDLPLPPALTGEEYLQLHRRLRQRDSAREELGLAEALGIVEHLDKLISEYSHGMKRKLQLTAALAHQPGLLVLDEPYRGLDPESSALLTSILRIFRDKGGAILVATHDMMRAELGCDEVGIIDRGRMAATGSPPHLCEQFGARDLEEVFLRSTGVDQQHADREQALASLLAPSRPAPVAKK